MVTFNSFQLRTDDAGKTFLDLEVTLTWHPQCMIMRYSFPATSDYYPDGLHNAPRVQKPEDAAL